MGNGMGVLSLPMGNLYYYCLNAMFNIHFSSHY